jgi:hypothetical protein
VLWSTSRDIADVLRCGCAGEPACLPNAPGPLWRSAGGGAGLACRAALFFCEENPLLNDDVPECEAGRACAGTLPARARQTIKSSAELNDFMMSFHKELNEKQHSAARWRLHR